MRSGDSDQAASFGFLVRMYRHDVGLTQRELAAKAGLSVAALRDFEQSRRYRPRPRSLAALASALGLDPDRAASLARAAAVPRRHSGPQPSSPPALDGGGPGPAAGRAERDSGLWLTMLGPLEAWGDGKPIHLGPPARRAILGLLMLPPGVLVRRDTIIDVLWGDSPPRTALGLVQAHVSRVRKLLRAHTRPGDAEELIESARGAYRLSLPDTDMDLMAFRDLAARAAARRADGDDPTAADLYEQAISLWRGEPLGDVDALHGHPAIIALRQELTDVLLRFAEIACGLGQQHRVLPRLQSLVDAEPLNEPAHARLMIALASSGRQVAAIRVYEDVRSRLNRELGIYPGEELAETYVRVLRQDIRAASPGRALARRPAPPAAGRIVPRQLPAAPRSFTGRRGELAALGDLERDLGQARGVVIAALTGMAGIGKTALAVHWAHQAAHRFPDGQLFMNLRGYGPSGAPVKPSDALRGFLTALGVPPAQVPPNTDGQAALYRSLLTDRRMLIVLDNAGDAGQVRPLLPGSSGCLVLVTSRNRLTGLAAADGARLVTLGALTAAESGDLLARGLGVGRAAAEPAATSELAARCGGLPLALCDVAARTIARPGLPLAAFAAEMRDERRRLDALETGKPATSVRKVFSWSRAKLGERAARMFRLLGVHPGLDITIPAAASLAGVPREQAYLALAELCDEHLLTEYVPGRYASHGLLRAYAAEEATAGETETGRRAAMRRVLDYYLHAAAVPPRSPAAPAPQGAGSRAGRGARSAATAGCASRPAPWPWPCPQIHG